MLKNNQGNDLNVNILTNLKSLTINRHPTIGNEVSNKKYFDDQLDKNTFPRFNQTIENYLKVSVGSDAYNLTKYDKIHLIDLTEIRHSNTGDLLILNWRIKQNFTKK